MRVISDLWVSALLRRAQSAGGFGAVLQRGSTEAGAIFIVSRSRLGDVTLYGPAPQIVYEEGKPQERSFSKILGPTDEAAIQARLEKERRFDPDLWIVEIEAVGSGDEEVFPVSMP